jgi:mutator protein MutT
MKHLEVAVAVVFRDSRVLIARRKPGGLLGGCWEFPGGKQEPGESLDDCVRRELKEELAISVQPVISLTPVTHQYPDRHVTLHAFLCMLDAGEPIPIACDEIRWVSPLELQDYAFPPANQPLIEQVLAALPTHGKTAPNTPAKAKRTTRQPAAL